MAVRNVLVVDDDPQVLKLVSKILTSAGYRVMEASNGRRALEVVGESQVDLILTDLIMPEQEGVETIAKVRKDHPAVRIIAMSGAAGSPYLRVAELMGAEAVLQKPFGAEELLQIVQKVLV